MESLGLLEKLKGLYQDLGEEVEDCFSNPDDFLTETKMSFLRDRYNELYTLKARIIRRNLTVRKAGSG